MRVLSASPIEAASGPIAMHKQIFFWQHNTSCLFLIKVAFKAAKRRYNLAVNITENSLSL